MGGSAARTRTASEESQHLYSIGDLAGEFEVSPRAIRFYEDQGLLAPRRIGNNRVYTQRDRARLVLILRGKRLGFSLGDIRELLDLYDADRHHLTQLRSTLARGRARIAGLEQQHAEITRTLKELRELEGIIVNLIREKEAARGGSRASTESQGKEGAAP